MIRKLGENISKAFIMGSNYFFKKYEDFETKDIDYIVLVDKPLMFKTELNIRGKNKDVYYYKRLPLDEFIELTLKQDPMCAGKFLIPEFCKELGFAIDHLKRLSDKFKNIDKKHSYEKIIYDAYIENNDFSLTENQRLKAYNVYKIYKK